MRKEDLIGARSELQNQVQRAFSCDKPGRNRAMRNSFLFMAGSENDRSLL